MKMNKNENNLMTLLIPVIVVIIIFVIIIGFFILATFFGVLNVFKNDVSFENESGEEIMITLIGIGEGGDEIGPIYSIGYPYEHSKGIRLYIDDDESLNISYDNDDQNLQFVIVEYIHSNDIRILKLDAEEWENRGYHNCCWGTNESSYSIPKRSELPECPEVLKPTIQGEYIEVTDELINILENL